MIKKFIHTLWGAPDKGIHEEPDPDPEDLSAVSYTHLTLPTSV